MLLGEFGTVAQYGCTDPNAINFNENADIDDGTCEYPDPDDEDTDGGGGVEEEDDEGNTGGGTDPGDNEIDVWNFVAGSPNASIYIGYDGKIDGDHTKGKHMSIEITANPVQGVELNLESLLVDHNTLVKKPIPPRRSAGKRKK